MKNSGTLIDKAQLKGGFSDELVASDFFKWWTKQNVVTGYIGSAERTEFRDKAMETYLKAKGCRDNAASYALASAVAGKMMNKVNADTAPKEFVEQMKEIFENPLKMIWEVLYQTGIKALSPIKSPLTDTNKTEIEEGVKLYLKMKEGKPLPAAAKAPRRRDSFEGRYENTEPGHDKFWEVYANDTNSLYTARWGRNGKAPQGFKDDYDYGQVTKLVREKEGKGYTKVS